MNLVTCYHPLIRRIHLGEYETATDGHRYPKADVIKISPGDSYEKYNNLNQMYTNYRYEKIPCGKCIGCRLDYSKQWAVRCMYETKLHDQSWFVTLTYDDEHKPTMKEAVNWDTGEIFEENGSWNGTLQTEDLTKFIKDLRRYWKYHYDHDGIRFYACGEYGSETKRPHYHAIIFNLNLSEDMLKYKFTNEEHQAIYECPIIEKIWGKGLIAVGNVTFSSCAYVARYITKKQTGEQSTDYYLKQGQIPEFIRMSRNPGIGYDYYQAKKDEIYATDEIIQTTCRGRTVHLKPPKYFDRMYDIDYPEDMKRIKQQRKISGARAEKVKMKKTTFTIKEQLEAEEKTQLIKSKKLVRSLD